MSKRHQASRRKAYGRRQHEIKERNVRRHDHEIDDVRVDTFGLTGRMEALGMELRPGTRRLDLSPAD